MKKQSKISNQLLIFIFSISFVLILGSFTIFYFYGKNYIKESSIKELSVYTQLFDQALNSQLEEYNNNVNASFYEIKSTVKNDETRNEVVKNIVKNNEDIFERVYFIDEPSKIITSASTVKIFGGEHIINSEIISQEKYYKIVDSLKYIAEFKPNTQIGIFNNHNSTDYYLVKKYNSSSILIRINGSTLFEDLLKRIYYSNEINFNLIDNNNVVQFSTNKFWVNQRIEKFLTNEQIEEKFYQNIDNSFICLKSKNSLFQTTLLITNNISDLVESFSSIIYKLLFYSTAIFLLITIATFYYSKKISKSLMKITDVAKSVGEGDFSKKIMLNRNDELGMLINSFNKMVDNLNESYNNLNSVNNELEQKIDELIKTKNELTKKQKLALIGETISKISHEIQNKISGVSIWVQNLEMQPNLDENLKMYIGEIKESLNSFVNMLLNFKKFYRKPFLEKEEIKISELINNVVENYCPDIEAKKIKLFFDLEDGKSIHGDKNLLEEVIVNLLVNAIYYTPKNGKISIKTHSQNSQMCLSINDSGLGINDAIMENIFHPFFTTKSSGSGLGLPICKNIIEAHSGEIKVKSKEGEGTEFQIFLPQ